MKDSWHDYEEWVDKYRKADNWKPKPDLWEGLKKRQERAAEEKKQSDAETMDALRKMAKELDDARKKRAQELADAQRQQAMAFKWIYNGGKYVASYDAYYQWISMGNTHHCPKCKIPIPEETVKWQPMMETNDLIRVHTRCGAKMVLE